MKFKSARLHTGAQKLMLENLYGNAYFFVSGANNGFVPPDIFFHFAEKCFACLRDISVNLPVSDLPFNFLPVKKLKQHVHLLICAEVLEKFKFVANNVESKLETKIYG